MMIILILLKTVHLRHTHTHTHTPVSLRLFFQGLTLVPGPKPVSSGSEPVLAQAPSLRCSSPYTSPHGNSQSFRELGSAPVTLNKSSIAVATGNWEWDLGPVPVPTHGPVTGLRPSTLASPSPPAAPCLHNKITHQRHNTPFFLQSLSWDRTVPIVIPALRRSLSLWQWTFLDLYATVTQGSLSRHYGTIDLTRQSFCLCVQPEALAPLS